MSSSEPDVPGLSVFGLPLPFDEFLALLPLAGELSFEAANDAPHASATNS